MRAIAETFGTSLVASAVRYVELAPSPCAVVYSEHGRVVWAKRSATFPVRIPPQLRIGRGAVASDYHERSVLDPTARKVLASAWFGNAAPATSSPLVEHAAIVPEPGWGGVLSLLGGLGEMNE